MASMRRTPEAMPVSPTILNMPIWPTFLTCEPAQSSIEKPGTRTTRTTSPYFSEKSAIAPAFLASSRLMCEISTSWPLRMTLLTSSSTSASCCGVTGSKFVKSKRRRSGVTEEPAWLTWSPTTCLRAACRRCVAVWLRAEASFFSWSTSILTVSPTLSWPSSTYETW